MRPFGAATAVLVSSPPADVVVATAVSVSSVGMGERGCFPFGAAAASLDTSAMVAMVCDMGKGIESRDRCDARGGREMQLFVSSSVMVIRLQSSLPPVVAPRVRNCRLTPPNFLSHDLVLIGESGT